jgi:hypothetical protein
MATRFEDVPDHVVKMVNDIRKGSFPELSGAKIKVLYDTKKRTSGGKLVLGRMQKTNDLLRHLTVDEANTEDGYDYIMYLCKAAFENIDDIDQVRIIRHELQHCNVDLDSNTNPYRIRDHELNDFYDEVEYNAVDPRWAERCATVAESIYESE